VTRFRCDGIFNNSFIANFQEIVKVKKKLKIGQYLTKLCLKYYWFLFSGHFVLSYGILGKPGACI